MLLWLLVIALLLFAWGLRESFQDPDFPVIRPAIVEGAKQLEGIKETRPSKLSGSWQSIIDAETPIGANDEDYLRVLQAFYDKVYEPSPTRPTVANIEAFLRTPDAQVAGVDGPTLRKIIARGFRIDPGETAAAKEQKQVVKTGALAGFTGSNLEPTNARDGTYAHLTQEVYVPADQRKGNLPEGVYEPVTQQNTPRREGLWSDDSTSWSDASFYSTCPTGFAITSQFECSKNVL
jgi:hypothetical protein